MVDLKLLRARAERAFPGGAPDSVLSRVRAIIGPGKAMPPTEEGRLATQAFSKLTTDGSPEPTPVELAALELMIRMTRPAPLFHDGTPDDFAKAEHSEIFGSWSAFQAGVQPLAHAIARIDRAAASLAASETIGTGFLVTPELLMTNKHVLVQLSRGAGVLQQGQSVARFQWEHGSFVKDRPVDIVRVAATHSALDVVLLEVPPQVFASGQRLPQLSPAALAPDADVVVAGYPANDSARNPLFIGTIFGTEFEVLRASPGQLTGFEASGFTHDCSTLGGNSGSPVFSMTTAEVVGLHRSGSFLWSNQAVDGASIAQFVSAHS